MPSATSNSPMRGMEGFYLLRQIAQILSGLEANGVTGRDRYLHARLGITADSPFAALHLKNAEPSQLDAIAGSERRPHGLDDRLYGGGGLGPGNLGQID